jgi:hypothetical protein
MRQGGTGQATVVPASAVSRRIIYLSVVFFALFLMVGIKVVEATYLAPLLPHFGALSRWKEAPYKGAELFSSEIFAVVLTAFISERLYYFRCRRLFVYGSIEILFGLVAALIAINQLYGASFDRLIGAFFSQMAALYICVRGLDNIYRSLPDGRFKDYWEVHFFDRPAD